MGLFTFPAPEGRPVDPVLADLRAVRDAVCGDVAPVDAFERAMSALAYSIGLIEAAAPKTKAQHNRLTDQILRLETVESKARRAILNGSDDGDDTPPPAAAAAVPQIMEQAA